MKPLRRYHVATIYFRDCNEPNGEYYEVNVYSSVIIFFDKKGHERTVPMVFVKEIIEYAEDRTEPSSAEQEQQPTNGQPIAQLAKPPAKIQSPKHGRAYHV